MAEIERKRRCPKCKQEKGESEYLLCGSSMFQPGHRSIYCVDCLERIVPYDDLEKVDQLMQWLNWPFALELWTKLAKVGKERTLHLYAKQIGENPTYSKIDWKSMNRKWEEEFEMGTLQDFLDGADEAFMLKMKRKWPSEMDLTIEDYHYLEDFYNDLLATQNLTTATQRDDAKRLAVVGLIANKKLQTGQDAKKEMDIYHNIIKAEGFEPKNAKNLGDKMPLSPLNFLNCWKRALRQSAARCRAVSVQRLTTLV